MTVGAEGSEISKRSTEALDAGGLAGAVGVAGTADGLDAKLKSPKSFDSIGDKLACGFCGGLEDA